MAIIGWQELILISALLILGVPVLILYFIVKHAVRSGVKEAWEEKGPYAQAAARLCQDCGRGVMEEAKFCPHCGTELKTG